MIQRIQSLFLLLAAGCFGGEFATSFATSGQAVAGIFSDQIFNLSDNPVLQIMAGLGAVLSLVALFLYNNRSRQLMLARIVATIGILLIVAALFIFMNQMQSLGDITVNDQMGAYLPIGMIAFSLLAARYIKKDDKLVSSMDRLR